MTLDQLLHEYEQGPELLRQCLQRVPESLWRQHPVPGTWSIHEVICHLADFESIGSERMKRVLSEDNPTMFGADPDGFFGALHYDVRSASDELSLISLLRRQMASILRQTDVESFQRTGVHTEAGPMTLETLLERITRHIPHHIRFIEAKIAALGLS